MKSDIWPLLKRETLAVLAMALLLVGCGDPSEDESPCVPLISCEEAEAECGALSDGCGGQLNCGECEAPQVCGVGGDNQCGVDSSCTPRTCAELDAGCGSIGDGCGAELDCGSCDEPETCGGGGEPNQCGCTPTTCELADAECGATVDGCGGTLDCGDCVSPLVCGESSPNQCAAPLDPCAEPSRQPPPGWTRLTTGAFSCLFLAGVGIDFTADCSTWEGIWRQPFPGGGGNPQRLGIGRFSPDEYLAIGLSTEGLPTNSTVDILFEGPGSGVTVTGRIATISACPGDFDFAAITEETGCVFDLTLLITRIRIGGLDTDRPCRLEPNSSYFLNIIHSSSPLGTPVDELESNCPADTFCGVLYDAQLN